MGLGGYATGYNAANVFDPNRGMNTQQAIGGFTNNMF